MSGRKWGYLGVAFFFRPAKDAAIASKMIPTPTAVNRASPLPPVSGKEGADFEAADIAVTCMQ